MSQRSPDCREQHVRPSSSAVTTMLRGPYFARPRTAPSPTRFVTARVSGATSQPSTDRISSPAKSAEEYVAALRHGGLNELAVRVAAHLDQI